MNIKDNPPPLPDELTTLLAPYPLQLVRVVEAAAFDRGLVAGQAEIERLKEKARLSEAECRKALDDRRQAFAMRDELRAKLKALESIDKNAAGWIRIVQGHTSFVVAETEWGPDKPDRPGMWLPLYTATGAKHD